MLDALKPTTGRVGSIDTLADLIISVAQSIATEYAHKQRRIDGLDTVVNPGQNPI